MLVKTGVLETEREIIIRIEQVLIFLVAFVFVFVLDMKLWSYLLHVWTEKLKQEGKNILERLISKAGLVAKREKSGSHSCLTQKKKNQLLNTITTMGECGLHGGQSTHLWATLEW